MLVTSNIKTKIYFENMKVCQFLILKTIGQIQRGTNFKTKAIGPWRIRLSLRSAKRCGKFQNCVMKLIFKAHRITKLIALCALIVLFSHFRNLDLIRKKRNQYIFSEEPLIDKSKEILKYFYDKYTYKNWKITLIFIIIQESTRILYKRRTKTSVQTAYKISLLPRINWK